MRRPVVIGAAGVVLVLIVCAAAIPTQRSGTDFRSARIAGSASQPRSDGYRVVHWGELVPAGWNERHALREMREELASLPDSDPRAVELLARMREIWKAAPANAHLDGAAVRIPGYVVPLRSGRDLAEFLLVPYFGACIHTPPPPSNQIIHVRLERAVGGLRAMDPVWVGGALRVEQSNTAEGTSSYAMNGAVIERYKPKGRMSGPHATAVEK